MEERGASAVRFKSYTALMSPKKGETRIWKTRKLDSFSFLNWKTILFDRASYKNIVKHLTQKKLLLENADVKIEHIYHSGVDVDVL